MQNQSKRRHLEFNYVGCFKYAVIIPLIFIAIGIVFQIVVGPRLSIDYVGGTEISYSFDLDFVEVEEGEEAELDNDAVGAVVLEALIAAREGDGDDYDISVTQRSDFITDTNIVNISIAGAHITTAQIRAVEEALMEEFEEYDFSDPEMRTVDESLGATFLARSLWAVVIAGVFIVLYIAVRFRSVGGIKAGLIAMIALLFDIVVVYFANVIFGITINENFMAVVLTILGYSLNDTIVLYDRIRENVVLHENKKSMKEIVNLSIGQTLKRAIVTFVSTFAVIFTVAIVAAFAGLWSILTFAIPMSLGIFMGAFTTIFLSGPLYAIWYEKSANKSNDKKNSSGASYTNRINSKDGKKKSY